MSKVEEIVDAVAALPAQKQLELFARLEQLEERAWEKEHRRVTRECREDGWTDQKIDELVLRKRYPGRRS